MKSSNLKSSLVIKRTAMFFMVVLMVAASISLTGCGGDKEASQPEKIINPLTGAECETQTPTRPVILSIDNVGEAVPQSNLSYADMVFEFPVEGLQTRLQAVFYTDFPEFVGPVRSVRPYFVDLAREYKAVHIGYGWSPDAKRYLKSSGVPFINGMASSQQFYRVDDKPAPHDAYIKWENIDRVGESRGWFDQVQEIKPFAFRDKEWKAQQEELKENGEAIIEEKGSSEEPEDMEEVAAAKAALEPAVKAATVSFEYSNSKSGFEYDEETGTYTRTWYGNKYVDKETGEAPQFDNILVQVVKSNIMTDENGLADAKGRLEIDMCAGGDALLFTKGQVIEGSWAKKKSPDSRTVFTDKYGNQLRLSKGKTWVNIADQTCTIKY